MILDQILEYTIIQNDSRWSMKRVQTSGKDSTRIHVHPRPKKHKNDEVNNKTEILRVRVFSHLPDDFLLTGSSSLLPSHFPFLLTTGSQIPSLSPHPLHITSGKRADMYSTSPLMICLVNRGCWKRRKMRSGQEIIYILCDMRCGGQTSFSRRQHACFC